LIWSTRISGHGFVQVVAADHHVHPGNLRGEEKPPPGPRSYHPPTMDDGAPCRTSRPLERWRRSTRRCPRTIRFLEQRAFDTWLPMASTTALAHHRPPVRERLPGAGRRPDSSRVISAETMIRAPNLAGPARNCPFGKVGSGDSAGESEVVSRFSMDVPAWPRRFAIRSMAAVVRPSDAAYTAAPSPAGPAAHHDDVGFVGHCIGLPAVPPGGPARCWSGLRSTSPPQITTGASWGDTPKPLQQPFGVLVTFPGQSICVAIGFRAANSRSRVVSGE